MAYHFTCEHLTKRFETGDVIFDLLIRLNRENGCGVLFVTHDPELADRANRKIEMRDGQVVAMSDVHHA